MKHHITLSLLLLFGLIACQKEMISTIDPYLQNVQTGLKDSVSNLDYAQLDFNKAVLSKADSVQLYILRIPFKEKKLANDFLIVKTTQSGQIQQGKIVHLEGSLIEQGEGKVKLRTFNGTISITSLDRKTNLTSSVNNGFVEAFHPNSRSLRTDVVPQEDITRGCRCCVCKKRLFPYYLVHVGKLLL